MTPTLIDYFPKRAVDPPEWLKAAGVEAVCSVSACVSEAPDGWISQWRHNVMWAFDTPELAWSVVPDAVRADFDLFAYLLFPLRFVGALREPFDMPRLDVSPLPPSFERFGYDVVSRSGDASFECSPLSCNYMAGNVAVNRYCLVDDTGIALRLAEEFEAGGCEPGPYYLVEVWSQRRFAR